MDKIMRTRLNPGQCVELYGKRYVVTPITDNELRRVRSSCLLCDIQGECYRQRAEFENELKKYSAANCFELIGLCVFKTKDK